MNLVEIGVVGLIAIVLFVILFVTLRNRNVQKQPKSLLLHAQQNLSQNLRLPTIADPSRSKIVPLATNLLVFRSHMSIYSPAQNSVFNFGKTPWQLPQTSDPKNPNTRKIQSQAIGKLLPSDGGLQSQADAYLVTPKGVTQSPNSQPLQILPWPPLASAQLVTQFADPTQPLGVNNPLQQNGNSTFTTTEPGSQQVPAIGIGPPNWNDPKLPTTAQRQQPRNDIVKEGIVIEKRSFVRVAGISDAAGADAQNSVNGTSTLLNAISLQFEQDGYVQVECAGGKGGYFLTGSTKDKNLVQQVGGNNGIVWAFIQVKKGQSWQVQLSQNGGVQSRNVKDIEANLSAFNSEASGGGQGSFLSGSEGGGSTWIAKENPCLTTESPVKNQCPERGKSNHSVLMAAGGGGGASRNAQGGNAGCSLLGAQVEAVNPNPGTETNVHLFNEPHPNPIFQGFPGGPTNVPDPTSQTTVPVQSSLLSNLSGGGGGFTNSSEGQSWNAVNLEFVPKELRSVAKKTSRGHPLQGGYGTDDPPGGGGGGAGYKGGGAGIWNQLAAPNNIHGAGGGGSSYIDPSIQFLSSSSEQLKIVNQNPYQTQSWRKSKEINNLAFQPTLIFEPTNQFLLGLPVDA